jgi:asparagine synthase (glutamine-hydrolysing)
MCGITGIIARSISTDRRNAMVSEMNNCIFHRGPDDDGFYSDETCTLAMRRLSIIDLHTGKQPLYSNCGRYLIFFNGEIYNYRELKEMLLKASFVFTTTSDTEVIVNLYKHMGKEMLPLLQGMFAFCIYDLLQKDFFFARDRFGEKPFYYFLDNERMAFSSEVGSLLSSDLFRPQLMRDKLSNYLRFGFVEEPFTLIKNVFSLPPGHYLELSSDLKKQVAAYTHVLYQPDTAIKSIEDAAAFIKPYFTKAVGKQMVSDVPIGAFLSGGIDSSSVVATMAQLSDKPVKTFTVKFQTKGYDESAIARKVAVRWATEHQEITVANSEFEEASFWKILKHTGLPFPDSSAIPTDLVTKEIVRHVKVALSGDGGDEVFAGYNVFDWVGKITSVSAIPGFIRRSATAMLNGLNRGLNNNKLRQVAKALKIAGLDFDELIREAHALFDASEINRLLKEGRSTTYNRHASDESLLRRSMRYRLEYDLPLDMLTKVDRMSMSNSLEVRAPFLDPDLFEASCRLPDMFLRQKGVGKLVIREMMKNDLPDEVFNHPKSGFSIPLHSIRNDAFRKLATGLLTKEYMYELFNADIMALILEKGISETTDDNSGSIYRKTHQLWSLMMLSGWIDMYEIDISA